MERWKLAIIPEIYPYTYDNTKNTITTTPKPSPNFLFLSRIKTILLFIPKLRAYFSDTHPDQDQSNLSKCC